MEERIYPAAVIGLGASGIAAAVYLSRMGISPIAFEPERIGGKLLEADDIRDYPGFLGSGKDLVARMVSQVEENHIQVVKEKVVAMLREPDGTIRIAAGDTVYRFYTVVIATGFRYDTPDIPGIDQIRDLISHRPTTDEAIAKGKPCLVWADGDRALDAASHLSKIASSVVLLTSKDSEFSKVREEELSKVENVRIVIGELEKVEKTESGFRAWFNGEQEEFSSLFILLGHRYQTPCTEFVGVPEIRDDQGCIAVDRVSKAFIPGVFACGDAVQKSVRNLSVDASEGAMAGIMAYRYYQDLKSDGKIS